MIRVRLTAILLISLAFLTTLAHAQRPFTAWQKKVDPWALQSTTNGGSAPVLVYLAEQADLSAAARLSTKEEKGAYVYAQLTAVAGRTQPAIAVRLDEMGAPYRRYWIANALWVMADTAVLQALAQRPDVAHIYANPSVLQALPPASQLYGQATAGIEWNVAQINAPNVWALGYTGQGVVVGGQDTGYEWQHPALQRQYRGWDGATADHAYNWHDAIHDGPPDNPCGFSSPAPCDDHNHGTHTMGSIAGNDLDPANPEWPAGAPNAIGAAPGAQWIGCRNMERGHGTPASYMECYQWFVAPYPFGGHPMSDGDPAKAPHVINNSWSCPPSEGCTDPEILRVVVENVRAAGIVTVHAAGNSGFACGTINQPAAIYDASFTVGATTSNDAIATFSSRGPVTVDGSGRLKPDVSAPGVGVRSAVRGGYSSASGTSMAGPHVAGLVALLISADPSLAGQVEVIEQIIRETAVPLTTTQGCGGDTPDAVPNHVYGYGRIDAWRAIGRVVLLHQLYLPFVQTD